MIVEESNDFRLQELAAGASLGDLSEAELHEIRSYDQKIFQAMVERSEEAAARTYLTFHGAVPTETMPRELTIRLKNMASGFFEDSVSESSISAGPTLSSVATALDRSSPATGMSGPSIAPSSMSIREIAAWLCVAASVALALSISLPGTTVRSISLQQQRDTLLASAPDLIRSSWQSATEKTPGADRGEVIWSATAQQGFMTIKGLPVNDATKEQYQLWIIDPERDEKPVDGGVFNIATAGESVIPIQAKLRVDKPTLFAITVEKPGGVVVSDQKRMPLLATVKSN